jgi:hypothetical protein
MRAPGSTPDQRSGARAFQGMLIALACLVVIATATDEFRSNWSVSPECVPATTHASLVAQPAAHVQMVAAMIPKPAMLTSQIAVLR